MSEQAAPAAPAAPVPAATPAPAAPVVPISAADKLAILRGFVARIRAGEFALAGGKDFHQFVVKEIYPLLGDGTLTVDDVEKVTRAFSAQENPESKDQG